MSTLYDQLDTCFKVSDTKPNFSFNTQHLSQLYDKLDTYFHYPNLLFHIQHMSKL